MNFNFLLDHAHTQEFFNKVSGEYIQKKCPEGNLFQKHRAMGEVIDALLAYETACALSLLLANPKILSYNLQIERVWGESEFVYVDDRSALRVLHPEALHPEVKDAPQEAVLRMSDTESPLMALLFRELLTEDQKNALRYLVHTGEQFSGEESIGDFYTHTFTKDRALGHFAAQYPLVAPLVDKFYLEQGLKGFGTSARRKIKQM